MENVSLSLYLNNTCNLNCSYCNIDHNEEVTVNEEQVKKFILTNKDEIDFKNISLYGGEPTIICSNQFITFLKENFKNITITTNLKDKKAIENLINILGNKASLTVSYNIEIDNILKTNIEIFKDYINKFNITVTKKNLPKLYDMINFLSKYESKILLSPEIDKNLKDYELDKEEFKKQLQLIFDNKLERNLINFYRIANNKKSDFEYCKKTCLSISKNGKLSSCPYVSDNYISAHTYTFGDLATKLKDINVEYPNIELKSFNNTNCMECKKCYNFNCTSRYMVNGNNKVQQQICEFHSTLYDFAHEYKYKPDLESITIFMTEQCNMKCTYCFEKDFKNRLDKASNEVIEKSMDLLFANDDGKEKKFKFFGGEPSLNIEGIRHALNYYLKLKENGLKSTVYFDINTNLLVLTDELIELFKEIRTHTPFYISVSCDGFKELNDKQRIDLNGNGTYDRVISNVKKLRVALNEKCNCTRIKIGKHTVLTNDNIPFINKICDEAWEQRYLFDEFSLAYITPGKGEHEFITKENLQKISDFYYNLDLKMEKEKKDFIYKYLTILNLDTNILYNYGYSLCDVINNTLSVRANGDIIACHAFLDKIDEDYSKIKIDNILNINTKDFGFTLNNPWYKMLNKNENINSGDLIIKSELGYDCKLCMFKFMCHTCIANLKEIKGNELIKTKEQCMRTLNQAEILLKIKEIQGLKELKELQEIENELIEHIREGITDVGELAVGNRKILMELIKNE